MSLTLRHLPFDHAAPDPRARELLRRGLRAPLALARDEAAIAATGAGARAGFDHLDRDRLAEQLEAHLGPLRPHVAVREAIDRLRREPVLLVGVAVRPTLLAMRLDDFAGVLQTVALARRLNVRAGGPVLPLVWITGDEPVVPAATEAFVPGPHHDLLRVQLDGSFAPTPADAHAGDAGPASLDRAIVDARRQPLGALRAFLRNALGGTPDRTRALELCLPRDGESLAAATQRFVLELFGDEGVIALLPAALADSLPQATAALLTAGHCSLAAEAPAVPLLVGGARQAGRVVLPVATGYAPAPGPGTWTPAELAALLIRPGEREFAPSASLLPLALQRVLPLAAWSCPPRTWEHLERQAVALRALVGTPLAVVPQSTITLLEAPVTRALLASGADGLDDPDILRLRAAASTVGRGPADRDQTPKDDVSAAQEHAMSSVTTGRAETPQALAALRRKAADALAIDPSLQAAWKRQAGRAEACLEEFWLAAERALRNRLGTVARRRRQIETNLRPRGGAQGATFGPLPWLARHGATAGGWLRELTADLEPCASEHVLCFFDETRENDDGDSAGDEPP